MALRTRWPKYLLASFVSLFVVFLCITLYFCIAALADLILIVPLLIFALLKDFYLDEKKGWTEPELMDRGEHLPVVIGLGIYSLSIAFFNLLLTHNFVLFYIYLIIAISYLIDSIKDIIQDHKNLD